ncbi:outer membrane beta-barrel protein, partial [Lishizhenia sp.]|uniref:outer membrane beta-barrel protein n=1 Tax=Lishizhenia sp. TaxID=2497594 RepID=UPI00299E37E3
ESKFSLGVNVFPNFSMGILSYDESSSSAGELFKNIETWKPSASTSILVEYTLKHNAFLGFGLGYQNNGEQTKKQALIFSINPTTGEPVYDPYQPSHAKSIYNHHNLEIPIYYRHLFNNRFYGVFGLSGIVNISNTRTSVLYYPEKATERNTKNDNSTEFRKINLSTNIGLGFDVIQKENFSFYIQPNAQFGILGLAKSTPINRNMLSIGISTGIRL